MIHAKQYGEGLPPLVVLHGLFGNADNWHSIAQKWSEHFTVYCLDLPNHGKSSRLDPVTFPAMSEAINAWLEENKLDSIYLLGHSIGGKVVMQMASDYPDKIKKLVVADIAPVTYKPSHTEIFKGLRLINEQRPSSRKAADDLLAPYEDNQGIRQFLLKNLKRDGEGHMIDLGLEELYHSYPTLLEQPPLREGIETETLFIKGEHSPYIQAKFQQQTLKHFPNASVKMIPDTAHWLHAEKPTTFASLVKRFLQG
ncbi:alpha/beta fold hydrolase [Marinomonas ostreistagni]|uniref:alpha/beta fold hydrolase n=1 Tax=Marinomonas ostreistagni TaxID=359209 RepID=UPI00194E5362|nr:alpha/beta fold hydrolase [Marinomonas ostreistagni]MBM6549644.1 alpha/beta fold hydrolase [Marinomonas ostreistagni]